MLKFGEIYVKKRKFYVVTKNFIYINDVDFQNIVVLSRYSIWKQDVLGILLVMLINPMRT